MVTKPLFFNVARPGYLADPRGAATSCSFWDPRDDRWSERGLWMQGLELRVDAQGRLDVQVMCRASHLTDMRLFDQRVLALPRHNAVDFRQVVSVAICLVTTPPFNDTCFDALAHLCRITNCSLPTTRTTCLC